MLVIIGYVAFATLAVFAFIDFIRYVNKRLNEKN